MTVIYKDLSLLVLQASCCAVSTHLWVADNAGKLTQLNALLELFSPDIAVAFIKSVPH